MSFSFNYPCTVLFPCGLGLFPAMKAGVSFFLLIFVTISKVSFYVSAKHQMGDTTQVGKRRSAKYLLFLSQAYILLSISCCVSSGISKKKLDRRLPFLEHVYLQNNVLSLSLNKTNNNGQRFSLPSFDRV